MQGARCVHVINKKNIKKWWWPMDERVAQNEVNRESAAWLRLEIVPQTWKRASTVRGGRVTSKRSRVYKRDLALLYRAAGGLDLGAARVGVEIRVYQATRRRADVDNYVKGVMDALQGVAWDDDSQIDQIIVERFRGADIPRIEMKAWTRGGV